MRVIVFLEPFAAQAESLTSQVAADTRIVGPPTWASTPGWLKGMDEPGAITIFCRVPAADANHAGSVLTMSSTWPSRALSTESHQACFCRYS